MTEKVTRRSRVRAQLEELTAIGPRMVGSVQVGEAAGWIVDRLNRFGVEVSKQAFRVEGWEPLSEAKLQTTTPKVRELECQPMIWSVGTPPGGAEGRLEFLGNHGIWDGSFIWRKFAIVKNGHLQAFVSMRIDGPAVPQPCPQRSSNDVAHVVIGEADGRLLGAWLEAGEEVSVRLDFSSRRQGPIVGHNLIAEIPGLDRKSEDEAIVCAHYDTVWTTPGAYDNASGVVALLALAEALVEHPLARPLRLIFFSGEEWHLAGSRAFVEDLNPKELARVAFVLNVDGIGRGRLLEVSVGPESFEWNVKRLVDSHGRRNGIRCVTRFPPLPGSDHAPFYEAGIPAAHLTFNDWQILHRFDDTPNDGSAENIVYVIDLVLHLLGYLPERAAPRASGVT